MNDEIQTVDELFENVMLAYPGRPPDLVRQFAEAHCRAGEMVRSVHEAARNGSLASLDLNAATAAMDHSFALGQALGINRRH